MTMPSCPREALAMRRRLALKESSFTAASGAGTLGCGLAQRERDLVARDGIGFQLERAQQRCARLCPADAPERPGRVPAHDRAWIVREGTPERLDRARVRRV